jgi:DNA repair exonuclease SbcCD ATPase subunit
MVNLIRMKLVNFIGIYLGTHLKEFEIDRSKSKNNICLLIGDNGSGKTSIISEMTPIPLEHIGSRNESRILPNEIGIKELDYLVDNFVLYKIKIIYDPTKPTKCFIKKIIDNKEIDLNPNGNVKSYLEIIEHELHMKKNYTNVGYLCGSGKNKNFVAMSPTERNNYISEWMPEIAEFLDAYKISSKIISKLKKDIDNYNKQIGNISSINYELELNFLNSNIQNLKDNLNEIDSKIIQLNTYQDQIKKNVRDYQEISNLVILFKRNVRTMNERYNSLIEKYKYLNELNLESDYNSEIQKYEQQIELYKNRLSHCEETINIISSEIASNESLLSPDEKISNTDLETIYSIIDQNNELLKNINKTINNIEEEYGSEIDEIKNFNTVFNELNLFINQLDSKFLYLQNFVSLDSIKCMDDLEKNIDEKLKYLELLKTSLAHDQEELALVNKEIYKYESTNLDENILMKRPDFCKSHSCGVIEELLKYLNPKNNLKEMYEKSKNLQEKVLKSEEEKQNIEEIIKDTKIGFTYYKDIIDYLYRQNDLIAKLPESLQRLLVLEPSSIFIKMNEIKLLIKDFNSFSSTMIKRDELIKSIEDMNNLKKLVTTNTQIQSKLNDLNAKYEYEMKNKETFLTKLNELKAKYDIYKNIKSVLQEREEDFIKYNSDIESLLKMKRNLNEINKITYIYNSNKNYIEKTLNVKKLEIENELQSLNKKRDEMTTFYISKRQIEKMRNELQEQFNRVNILNKIWSPKVGYPSWKIESFLNNLTIKTNDDMNSMWGSNLKIKEFELKENDFLIKMIKDGVEIKDASLCSQGETETINTAISFSIIESNVENGGYDVLRLDEVDGPLDETRRMGFIDMIQKRVDEMGCDSCFIITHNGEFEDIPCDMILLKGAKIPEEKLRNKNILFKY